MIWGLLSVFIKLFSPSKLSLISCSIPHPREIKGWSNSSLLDTSKLFANYSTIKASPLTFQLVSFIFFVASPTFLFLVSFILPIASFIPFIRFLWCTRSMVVFIHPLHIGSPWDSLPLLLKLEWKGQPCRFPMLTSDKPPLTPRIVSIHSLRKHFKIRNIILQCSRRRMISICTPFLMCPSPGTPIIVVRLKLIGWLDYVFPMRLDSRTRITW